jgi:acyl-CoA synthetase (AMP-forming)/AMP-acid ligase II
MRCSVIRRWRTCVIGVPDERWGEAESRRRAEAGSESDGRRIDRFARTHRRIKLPKPVDFIAELPRNPSGKVLKRELRKPFWEGRERQVN